MNNFPAVAGFFPLCPSVTPMDSTLDRALAYAPVDISMKVYPRELIDVVVCANRCTEVLKGKVTDQQFENWIAFIDDVKAMALNYGGN
tara:strand:- start:29256 stop:29519 length:264 start_codon:yes stop_codon:yes gene_type:complete